jgi:enamine deaminase RidA (YjgF/YER057c/UK114 family)
VSAEATLKELGIELPPPPLPAGLYSPTIRSGSSLYVSGQLPTKDGQVPKGYVGGDVTVEAAALYARQCAINALSAVRGALGTLDAVKRTLRVAGYVASAPGFTDHPAVVNGASQLLIDVFGEAGKHARIAIGVAELPRGAPVEVEFLFEV